VIEPKTMSDLKSLAVQHDARDALQVAASIAFAVLHGRRPALQVLAELRRNRPELFLSPK